MILFCNIRLSSASDSATTAFFSSCDIVVPRTSLSQSTIGVIGETACKSSDVVAVASILLSIFSKNADDRVVVVAISFDSIDCILPVLSEWYDNVASSSFLSCDVGGRTSELITSEIFVSLLLENKRYD